MSNLKVFAVVYSNYDPAEVDSLWTTETEANKRRAELNAETDTGIWKVTPWLVQETWKRRKPAR